jgi:LysM repeat protein
MAVALIAVCVGCATPGPETASPTKQGAPAAVQPGATEATQTTAPAVTTLPEKTPGPREAYYIHTVKWSGESLSIIAAWYTGDLQNWKALAEANPDVNPKRIRQGMKIKIPERLLTVKSPMTKEHVDSFYPKAKKPAPERAPATPDDEPKLYGPKELPTK